MRVIGLTGEPEAGKSTAAKHLAAKYGLPRINVGDPIKEMLRGFFRWCGLADAEIERRLTGDLKEAPDRLLNGKTPRYAMQTLGKEWRDLISAGLFADRWEDRVRTAGGAVSDGMRYPDEMPGFRRLGGFLIEVRRPGNTAPGMSHIAEQQCLRGDVVIENDMTSEFFRKVDETVSTACMVSNA